MSSDASDQFYSDLLILVGSSKVAFDSTYPAHLNGIIGEDQFRQSIININQAISSRKQLRIFGVFVGIFIFCGVILMIVGGTISARSDDKGFLILIVIEFGLLACGPFVWTYGSSTNQAKVTPRMRTVIAIESMKYSTQSPIPCSWRLDTGTTVIYRFNGEERTTDFRVSKLPFMIQFNNDLDYFSLLLQIIIEIGRSTPSQDEYMSQPPAYNATVAEGFSFQC